MLELRPNCENCNKPLPPSSTEAMICSYECTYCDDCVSKLENVCPNCGGGFERRPVRPVQAWKAGVSVGFQPASIKTVLKPVDWDAHAAMLARVGDLAPEHR